MKIGIMGGTFDPIHIGHLLAGEAARDAYGLDQVWFMPSHIPPHKHQAGASGKERLEMTSEAVAGHPAFEVLDIEVLRGGVSYTIDTIKELQELHSAVDFYFIIGADMVNYLPHWQGIEELAQRICFIGVRRPGFQLALDELPHYLKDKVLLADMPVVDISSTDIRERAAEGRTIRYLVPDRVHDYITRGCLYEVQP
ncbi:nicotinate-nucleotide adenylyltransferase [Paenibacillus sp. S33]|uniref:nicotinate-nucleotide adenylyltransferase n=1 Tax=Paenibacillus TaxID=44249 RepID=UPI0004D33E75|nr:nicotinate-nucleotide adenylyltransferase [Paenibacillus polymyxa]AOK89132.1 nicotinate (nicotinamide) nucleotide adenylyltransferase [Paenibacillus polymyxa]KEO78471.1 nicotinic acid mononucleotide adenylyltransferase [Paenibacillus polymyxa]KYG94367.1 nicotinate-nicotinamide nucleotide adenylyltransferase [Paenibacillus polymyxa]MCH6186939.1 nicotinate-nucleotide adenylyltransferase [Paenibacillus polymyxa]WRL58734.1 nicotinate-nucleotide adenylyltransferase [Paenibacillus polymyxa]